MLVVAFARKEDHSHRIQGPSAGQNGLVVRTAWDALRMCAHWLGYQHCGVRVLATVVLGGTVAGCVGVEVVAAVNAVLVVAPS